MRKLVASMTLASFGFTVTGCSGIQYLQAQSRVDPQTVAVYERALPPSKWKDAKVTDTCARKVDGDFEYGAINLDCFTFPEDTVPNDPTAQARADQLQKAIAEAAKKGAAGDKAAEAAAALAARAAELNIHGQLAYVRAVADQGARNRLGAILLKQSDDVCTVELGRLTANQAMVNTGFSTATTIFSTAGAIVTGKLAGNILSGLATGTNATRDHVNAEVYRNVMSTAVTKMIKEERDGLRKKLLDKMATSDLVAYNVDQMIMDINEYHQTCSFYRGLDMVLKAVDRSQFDNIDPRHVAELELPNVQAQIAAIDRQLARTDLSKNEITDLKQQRATLRHRETELMTQATSLPPPSAAALYNATAPDAQRDDAQTKTGTQADTADKDKTKTKPDAKPKATKKKKTAKKKKPSK